MTNNILPIPTKMNKTKMSLSLIVVLALSATVYYQTAQQQDPLTLQARYLQTYLTTSTRSKNIEDYCPSTIDRNGLVDEVALQSSKKEMEKLNSQLGIDGNKLIYDLFNGNTGSATTDIETNASSIGTFMAVFLLPFLVFLFIWPFLICCCCCPSCCPSKCCQQDPDQQYTKCELYWPVVVLILALLLAIISSMYGFVYAANISKTTQDFTCSLSIFLDDFLNGNVTLSGDNFFMGLNVLSNRIGDLGGNVTAVTTSIQTLTTGSTNNTLQTVLDQCTTTKTAISVIPDGTANGTLILDYNTPINQVTVADPISSTFPTLLGDPSTTGTMIYLLYNAVVEVETVLKGMRVNANNFSTNGNTITVSASTISATVADLVENIQDMDNNMNTNLKNTQYLKDYGEMAMQVFYGSIIGFCFLALIGVLFVAGCQKYGCRHLMYFSCFLIFFVGLLAFTVAAFFSFTTPLFLWTCDYIDYSLASQANFNKNFQAFLDNETRQDIGICMPFGNGSIVNTVGGGAKDALNNLTSLFGDIGDFDVQVYKRSLTQNMSTLDTKTSSYSLSQIVDITDSTTLSILTTIATPTSSSWSCAAPGFTSDSWIPSVNQDPTYISCRVSGGNAQFADCNAAGAFTTRGGTCVQCMDTAQVTNSYATTADLKSDLDTRYPGCGADFNTDLSNVWNNYFKVKRDLLGPTVGGVPAATGVYPRTVLANTEVTALIAGLDPAMPSLLQNIQTSLVTINDLMDVKYGFVAGLNCKIFGQDFVTFRNSLCGSFFNSMYLIRLTLGIACYGILFAMCCIVCTGVRYYKHNERKNKVSSNIGGKLKNFDEGSKGKINF